jgi:LPXTG-site transpeptidase (sortase) family protein
MNTSYFFKQAKFYFHPPQAQTDNTSKDEKGQPNTLSIPSLGITAPIVEPKENNEASFQEALKTGVVHYPGTAAVGELGNPYIFGHSSDFAFKGGSFKTVFALLPKIQKGADIVVTNGAGQVFHYQVTDSFVAKSTDTNLLDQKEYKEKLLTLQTSYPIGTALKRWIVQAKLVE